MLFELFQDNRILTLEIKIYKMKERERKEKTSLRNTRTKEKIF
jgi:hypothetical protein